MPASWKGGVAEDEEENEKIFLKRCARK